MRGKKGFSLLEVIISLAALAFISVFLLEMFLLSSKVNLRAKNMDYAANYAINIIEQFKALDSAGDFLVSREVLSSQLSIGNSEFIIIDENGIFEGMEINREITIYKFFDKNWQTVEIKEVESSPLTPENMEVKFVICIRIIPGDEPEESGGLYNLSLEARDISYQDDKAVLYSIEASKYFPLPSLGRGVIYTN